MKAIIYRCPNCGDEQKELDDENNLHGYSETIIIKRCQSCRTLPKTAEERLLEAIFSVDVDEGVKLP